MDDDWIPAHDALLEALDAAPCGAAVTFRTLQGKERYETMLSWVRRRIAAAEYHKANIDELVARRAALTLPITSGEGSRSGTLRASVTFSDDTCLHEFAAFLASLKSAADCLAKLAFTFHIKGEEGDSVSDLLRRAERSCTTPIDKAIGPFVASLARLRAYRDELIHRRAPGGVATCEVIAEGDLSVQAQTPMAVPRDTATLLDAVDTRRTRLRRTRDLGLRRVESRRTITVNGVTTPERLGLEYQVADGFVRIEDFTAEELRTQKAFFREMCAAFVATGFLTSMGRHH